MTPEPGRIRWRMTNEGGTLVLRRAGNVSVRLGETPAAFVARLESELHPPELDAVTVDRIALLLTS